MDIIPAAAALAVIMITAGFILRAPSERDPKPERSTPQADEPRPDRHMPGAAREAEQAHDPWIVEPEPLIVAASPEDIAPGAGGPVLAYVDQPRRSPDPSRFIQTEVLVPASAVAQIWRTVRLVVSVLAFGIVFGFGSIALVRVVMWFFNLG